MIKKQKEKEASGGLKDQRYWKPRNPEGNEKWNFKLRILPGKDDNQLPWVRTFKHNFLLPDGSYVNEDCPGTISVECPICSVSRKYFQTGDASDEIVGRKLWRKARYVCNVLVIKDPQTPENEGKVFLWEFGRKIYDKFDNALFPEDEDESKVFMHPTQGYDFNFITRKVAEFPNYDDSYFSSKMSSLGKDDEIDEILDHVYDLSEFTNPSKFKSADELQKIVDRHEGNSVKSNKKKESKKQEETPEVSEESSKEVEEKVDEDKFDLEQLEAELAAMN